MRTAKALATTDGLSSLQRPRFSPGLLLEDEDLTAGVTYTRDMMRLMFRSLFGCGVICGLDVIGQRVCRRRELKVSVGGGLALDCEGNPIHIQRSVSLSFDPDCDELPETIWVAVCYTEKCCRPRDISCSSDDDGSVVRTRSHDGFEIRLYGEQPACACSCEPPKPPDQRPTGDGCCGDVDDADIILVSPERPAGTPEITGEREPAGCECYKDHNDGRCAPECDSRCVVIAQLHTRKDKDGRDLVPGQYDDVVIQTSVDARRWIRPVLTGFLPCIQLKPARSGDVIYRQSAERTRTEPRPA